MGHPRSADLVTTVQVAVGFNFLSDDCVGFKSRNADGDALYARATPAEERELCPPAALVCDVWVFGTDPKKEAQTAPAR